MTSELGLLSFLSRSVAWIKAIYAANFALLHVNELAAQE